MTPSSDRDFASLAVGLTLTRQYAVTDELYRGFLALFDDRSPIHVDDERARARGFAGRVMHGAILNGFLSHFVGMELPGARSLLQSVDMRYTQPVYLGERLELTGTITQRVDSQRVVVLTVSLRVPERDEIVARGRVQVEVRD
jgi:3-hydroxybutyryl-CoA dehydratase